MGRSPQKLAADCATRTANEGHSPPLISPYQARAGIFTPPTCSITRPRPAHQCALWK
jgi:hypothetical protein